MRALLSLLTLLLAAGSPGAAEAPPPAAVPPAAVPVQSFQLANGMRFLLVPRPERTTVAAGWVARVGSADETPGRTGLTHLVEHMLFKGTETVGTRDFARERTLLAEQDRLMGEIQRLRQQQSPELARLERRFDELVQRHRSLVVPGELGRLYGEAGAQGLNALTLPDMTVYFVTVPAEKLELWFWLESDRLLEPVFRELYTERDVVREERRQRTESTPTGLLDEELQARFWGSHPYGRPVLGWPADVEALQRADAEEHFAAHFHPGNLTAALVGRFDPAEVRALAERYFGRLEPPGVPAPAVAPPEEASRQEEAPEQQPPEEVPPEQATPEQETPPAARRMVASCDCRPRVQALYPTVPFVHPDTAPLEVLAGLLNGRTGRLYRSLVLERGIAFSAYALQNAMRRAGMFSFTAEAKGDATLEQQLAAWEEELEDLRRQPVSAGELRKVKNQIAADAYRGLREPSQLMMQLLTFDGLGDWRRVVEGAERALAVTPEEVQRVVRAYFAPERRTVGLYHRKGAEPERAAPAGGGG